VALSTCPQGDVSVACGTGKAPQCYPLGVQVGVRACSCPPPRKWCFWLEQLCAEAVVLLCYRAVVLSCCRAVVMSPPAAGEPGEPVSKPGNSAFGAATCTACC
jgi:hypothetical protein